ncbi:MAG: PP2C family protein-serine/threonine phosphatase [Candidatus Velthaea sp.]
MSPPILLLIAVFAAVAVVGGIVGVRQLDAASSAQVRLATARDDLDGLLRNQLAEETGLRGFLATGRRDFLEPDGPPTQTFAALAGGLAHELAEAGITAGPALVRDLRFAHDDWESQVKTPLLADARRGDRLAKQIYGKQLTDRMRKDASTLRDALNAAGNGVQTDLGRRINATVAVSVGIITCFAIAALVLALARAQAVEALEREQSIVAALQQTLRVQGVQLPRTTVGWAYASATREALVGGDLIDTWRADAHRGWFLIADASGKGIEAARHSAFVQYAIRTLTAECDDPAAVLERFNRLFLDTFDDPNIFVVLFLGAFDAHTGLMRYASAGHATAFIQRGTSIQQLGPTGSIIGLDREERYEMRIVAVAAGETIVLATDGLTESRDVHGELLGDEGVMRLLRDAGSEPQTICNRLAAEVSRRSRGEVHDDLAILALRVAAVDDPAAVAPFTTMGA